MNNDLNNKLCVSMTSLVEPYPTTVTLEDIDVQAYPNPESLFQRIVEETQRRTQTLIYALNVNAANIAFIDSQWRSIIQKGHIMYCDGAGIVLGSKILGTPLPCRLTAADWLLDAVRYFSENGLSVYFLAGEPGIPERAMALFDKAVPEHRVLGAHHGYILDDPTLENAVIDEINRLKPDILLVGFGMPLQEYWIEKNRHRLQVASLWAIGATLDYLTGKVSRCPGWMGRYGLEWLYRLLLEPKRMWQRYVVGNPWFLLRIIGMTTLNHLRRLFFFIKRPIAPANS